MTDLLGDAPADVVDRGTAAAFERFYASYPKKKGRKPAFDVWQRKALDKYVDMIVADCQRRRMEDTQWKRGIIPEPARYLRDERWKDEISKHEPVMGNQRGEYVPKSHTDHLRALAFDFKMEQGEHETQEQWFDRIGKVNKRRLLMIAELQNDGRDMMMSRWMQKANIRVLRAMARGFAFKARLKPMLREVHDTARDFEQMEAEGFRDYRKYEDRHALEEAVGVILKRTIKQMQDAGECK